MSRIHRSTDLRTGIPVRICIKAVALDARHIIRYHQPLTGAPATFAGQEPVSWEDRLEKAVLGSVVILTVLVGLSMLTRVLIGA